MGPQGRDGSWGLGWLASCQAVGSGCVTHIQETRLT